MGANDFIGGLESRMAAVVEACTRCGKCFEACPMAEPAGLAGADLRNLASTGPLWQLKVNCLQYCRFVHSHHTGESAMIFPALRRSNPALNPVIDRLEADHARVADLLDQVEGAARSLGGSDDGPARARLAEALGTLAVDLLEAVEDAALDLRPYELALVVPLVACLLALSAWPAAISERSFPDDEPERAVAEGGTS